MDQQQFKEFMGPVMERIAGGALDAGLEADLNRAFPAGGDTFRAIEAACLEAIDRGWMCAEGSEGRRFSRVVEAAPGMMTNDDKMSSFEMAGPLESTAWRGNGAVPSNRKRRQALIPPVPPTGAASS